MLVLRFAGSIMQCWFWLVAVCCSARRNQEKKGAQPEPRQGHEKKHGRCHLGRIVKRQQVKTFMMLTMLGMLEGMETWPGDDCEHFLRVLAAGRPPSDLASELPCTTAGGRVPPFPAIFADLTQDDSGGFGVGVGGAGCLYRNDDADAGGSKSLDKTARLGAVRAVGATCSDSHWSKAVLLLDRYSSYCASLPKLPLTCAAIARIVAKLEIGGHYERDLFLTENSGGWMVAQDFATWVGMTFGCTTEEITDSTLSKHEFEVLKALDWKVDWPCLEQWLHTISARFSVLTGAQNNEQLQMMMRSILISARAILTTEAPHKLSHGDLAMGLFGAHVLLEPLMGTPDELGEAGRSAATCPDRMVEVVHSSQAWRKCRSCIQ
ncbi:Uncharacterized protein SCF082_LOCUS46644 [Durusdinium trenchii]|uniref:Uncharacterized protein n=1 Tax=Durusdinium trenchii TaxID=1381693 RepID=A0ABP0RG88_9DINO